MSCSREPCLPHFLQIIPRFGPNMEQMSIFPVQKFNLHQFKTRFANLEEDLCLAGPTSGTPPHRAPSSTTCSIAHRKIQRTRWIARLYSGITQLFSIGNSPKLLDILAMLFYVLLEILALQAVRSSQPNDTLGPKWFDSTVPGHMLRAFWFCMHSMLLVESMFCNDLPRIERYDITQELPHIQIYLIIYWIHLIWGSRKWSPASTSA